MKTTIASFSVQTRAIYIFEWLRQVRQGSWRASRFVVSWDNVRLCCVDQNADSLLPQPCLSCCSTGDNPNSALMVEHHALIVSKLQHSQWKCSLWNCQRVYSRRYPTAASYERGFYLFSTERDARSALQASAAVFFGWRKPTAMQIAATLLVPGFLVAVYRGDLTRGFHLLKSAIWLSLFLLLPQGAAKVC